MSLNLRSTPALALVIIATSLLAADARYIRLPSVKRQGIPFGFDFTQMSKCQMHREMALSAPPVLMFDIWIPKCSLFDGSYETEQCTNDGRCFCTERNGKTIAGSETEGRMPQCNSIPDASPGANVIQDNNWIPITH